VEYEILASEHEGPIEGFSSSPNIKENLRNYLLFIDQTLNWNIDIDNFEVPFQTDGYFVTTEEKYAFYTGLSMDKVLSVGYDNIVLKRFYHSKAKYYAGFKVSLDNQSREMEEISDEKTRNTLFTFDWDVVAGKIVQKEMILKETIYDITQEFFIEKEYDESGRRLSEEWKVNYSKRKEDGPILLFTQNLTY
jgi:hypothetical protein